MPIAYPSPIASLAFSAILFCGSTPCAAQPWTAELDSVLGVLAADSLFDGQVLIAEGDSVLFHGAYGALVDARGREVPITPTTPLVVHSVGKSMTALAVAQLARRGAVDLDAPLTDVFPELPYAEATARDLLTMTSGLPRFLETALRHGDTTAAIGNDDVLALVAEHRPPAGAPGERFAYSNANYLLLASLVERVAGVAFGDYLRAHVFAPLGMEHSRETRSGENADTLAGPATAETFYRPYGAGSVATTAADLHAYARYLLAEGRATYPEAFACVDLADGSRSDYGFGWRLRGCDTLRAASHVGDDVGMRASLQLFVDRDAVLAYLHPTSNAYHEGVYEVVRAVWEGRPYELPTRREAYPIDTALYGDYVGSYLSGFGLVHVSREGGRLFLRPDAIPGREELVPSSDSTFFFAGQNLEWAFYRDGAGEVVGFGIAGDRAGMGVRQ